MLQSELLKQKLQTELMNYYKGILLKPFQKVSQNLLLAQHFYQQNQGSVAKQNQQRKILQETVAKEDEQSHKDMPQRINIENQQLTKLNKILLKQYRTLDSFLKYSCKDVEKKQQNTKQMSQITHNCCQQKQEQYLVRQCERLNVFLAQHQLTCDQLQNLIVKSKNQIKNIDKKKEEIKKIRTLQKVRIMKDLLISYVKLSKIKKSIQTGITSKKQIKKVDKFEQYSQFRPPAIVSRLRRASSVPNMQVSNFALTDKFNNARFAVFSPISPIGIPTKFANHINMNTVSTNNTAQVKNSTYTANVGCPANTNNIATNPAQFGKDTDTVINPAQVVLPSHLVNTANPIKLSHTKIPPQITLPAHFFKPAQTKVPPHFDPPPYHFKQPQTKVPSYFGKPNYNYHAKSKKVGIQSHIGHPPTFLNPATLNPAQNGFPPHMNNNTLFYHNPTNPANFGNPPSLANFQIPSQENSSHLIYHEGFYPAGLPSSHNLLVPQTKMVQMQSGKMVQITELHLYLN